MSVTLSERTQDVLRTLIQTYVVTGEPVSSRSLAERLPHGLSSASIRNIMAGLEDVGFLERPHPSAGRVPTDQGYRFYVDNLKAFPAVSPTFSRRVNVLYDDASKDLGEVLNTASLVLSQLSQQLGIVLATRTPDEVYQHITFARLRSRHVLALFVTEAGAVYKRHLEVEFDLSQEKLNAIANYLNEEFVGRTLSSIRDDLLAKMRTDREQYNTLLQRAIRLCEVFFIENDETSGADVYVEGVLNIIEQPEFMVNVDKMRTLLEILEERNLVVKLIDRCLRDDGVCVTIGSENEARVMHDCAVITRAYRDGDQVLGALGIIGPKRLLYPKMIGLVDYAASVVSNVLSGSGPDHLPSYVKRDC